MDLLQYLKQEETKTPLLITGEALSVLSSFPQNSIDCIITSPPYYNQREYIAGGIGEEKTITEYISNILAITKELHRVLKPSGSFWLNIGDTFKNKNLLNLPYRIAIAMQDEQHWILRNTIIWDKVKGAMTRSNDNLASSYEPIFHFVKQNTDYYYNADAVRKNPRKAKVKNGTTVSATGVTGISYKRKIELSTELTEEQKQNALKALNDVLIDLQNGKISDFRMVIKGTNSRITNGNNIKLSGRAKELADKGFYFLFYNPKGSMISDLWQIIPEDTRGRKLHFAPFPEDLVKTPIALTCPEDGIVLDPFVGTGTTCFVAALLGRKSIGIDIAKEYIELAKNRCK